MKVAILSTDPAANRRLRADLATQKHLQIDAFDAPDEAVSWLTAEAGGIAVLPCGAKDDAYLERIGALRQASDPARVPILAVLPPDSPVSSADALSAGADEICRADAHPAELRNRIGLLLTLQEVRRALSKERDNRIDHAILDPLSGCMNRRAFMDRLNGEIARVRRRGSTLCLAIMDVDRLRDVNAIHGHAQGDAVLGAVGGRCRSALREMDFAGRLGGTEFALCLPEVDMRGGGQVLDRLRRGLSTLAFPSPRGPLTITVSIGLTTLSDDDDDAVGPINRADRALLAAKDKGGDRLERG